MLSGLPCIIAVLLRNGYSLEALPVIALLEWVTQHVRGNLLATVAVRLQRVQALTQLGLLAEAALVLGELMLVQSWITYYAIMPILTAQHRLMHQRLTCVSIVSPVSAAVAEASACSG